MRESPAPSEPRPRPREGRTGVFREGQERKVSEHQGLPQIAKGRRGKKNSDVMVEKKKRESNGSSGGKLAAGGGSLGDIAE